ncbi:MAG: HDOD domain-containing protein [Candidatus Eisenbacteria bacterium]
MVTRILFVDDEPNVLEGLRRLLHPVRDEWETTFATGGREALEILDRQRHDVIVSDIRMPGMSGAELLETVRRLHPHMVRIGLSGHSDQETMLRSLGATHQYLTKPCEIDLLKKTIRRSLALQEILSNERLRALVSRLDSLPSVPSLYAELMEEMASPSCSLQRVGKIVAQDAGMTAQILRLVNSAYFGLRHEVSSPEAAVIYLGLNMISSLVLGLHLFRQVDEATCSWLHLDRIWQHGVRTGALARAICETEGQDARIAEESLSAGLIHDAGRLVLAVNLSGTYRAILDRAHREGLPLAQAERAELGVTHAEVGAYLIGLWGLPSPVVEALAFHHAPSALPATGGFAPVTSVHVACALDHERQQAGASDEPPPRIDPLHLESLGLRPRLEEWRRICAERAAAQAEEDRDRDAA